VVRSAQFDFCRPGLVGLPLISPRFASLFRAEPDLTPVPSPSLNGSSLFLILD